MNCKCAFMMDNDGKLILTQVNPTCPEHGATVGVVRDEEVDMKAKIAAIMERVRMREAMVVAIALSYYAYNVSAGERAQAIWDHFQGDCLDLDELIMILQNRGTYAATELPYPSAKVYVQQALDMYGEEARKRIEMNE